MHASDPATAAEQAPDLVIVARQWWWEIRYTKSGVVTANEIHIPAGERILARIESADVIHNFWVPQLGRKMDAIPGHPNQMWLQADTPGIYEGTCSEYCGAQHAWMRIRVVAQTPSAFATWQQAQQQVPALPGSGDAGHGARLFQSMTCANCHAIAGTGADATVGPNLTHVGSRATLGAGVLENTPDNLAKWLASPQAVKPGNHMPNLKLTDTEISALVAYLESLQ